MNENAVRKQYHYLFDNSPSIVVRTPGRINIIGEHTDYTGGLVMPAAIDRYIWWALSRNETQKATIHAVNFDKTVVIGVDQTNQQLDGWATYLDAILTELRLLGHRFDGMQGTFGGDIPVGAGLSSSAAFTCGFIYALNHIANLGLTRLQMAQIGQRAEHRVGIQCGIMDQFAVLHAQKDHCIQLDCQTLTHQMAPLQLGEYQLVLFDTNVKHTLADTQYNDRRASCERSLGIIQRHFPAIQSLRETSIETLKSLKRHFKLEDFWNAEYIILENKRVEQAAQALHHGDLAALGKLLNATHLGLSRDYRVSCPELDFLVNSVLPHPRVLGARMMGGGFGGCTLNLMHKDAVADLFEDLAPRFLHRFGHNPTCIIVQSADGATLID